MKKDALQKGKTLQTIKTRLELLLKHNPFTLLILLLLGVCFGLLQWDRSALAQSLPTKSAEKSEASASLLKQADSVSNSVNNSINDIAKKSGDPTNNSVRKSEAVNEAAGEPVINRQMVHKRVVKKEPPHAANITTWQQTLSRLNKEGRLTPQHVGPDTYLLLDKDGNPQPFLGFSYEEFMRAWKASHQEEDRGLLNQPKSSLQKLILRGTASPKYVTLEVRAEILLYQDSHNASIEVPLGMSNGILKSYHVVRENSETTVEKIRKQPRVTVSYEKQHGGYLLWVEGEANERVTVLLTLLVPTKREGSDTLFHLHSLRAVESELKLKVAGVIQAPTVSPGAILGAVINQGNTTHLTVEGIGGDFQLRWAAAQSAPLTKKQVLSVTGEILIALDGSSIRSQARLNVESYGGEFESLLVWLPPQAKLLPTESLNYRISEVDQGDDFKNSDQVLVRVNFVKPHHSFAGVILETERETGLSQTLDRNLLFSGFRVEGAIRQHGKIGILELSEQWQLRMNVGQATWQINREVLSPWMQSDQLTTAFQYYQQPWSLVAETVPRSTFIEAIPKYDIELKQNEAILNFEVAYLVPGAKVFRLDFDLNGWERTTTPIQSEGLLDNSRVLISSDQFLSLGLKKSAPHNLKISMQLRRPLETNKAGEKESLVSFKLPQPVASSRHSENKFLVRSGTMTLHAKSNLQITPDTEHLIGLVPKMVASETTASSGYNQRIFYQCLEQAELFFKARIRHRSGEIITQVDHEVRQRGHSFETSHFFNINAKYEPVQRLTLTYPEAIRELDKILFTLTSSNGDLISDEITVTRIEGSVGEKKNAQQILLTLPQPQQGKFRLSIKQVSKYQIRSSEMGQIEIPLFRLENSNETYSRAMLYGDGNQAWKLGGNVGSGAWEKIVNINDNLSGYSRLVSKQAELVIPLTYNAKQQSVAQGTTVIRSWFQTWVAGNTRQDRAVYRIRTSLSALRVKFNEEINELEIRVNGQITPYQQEENLREIVVPMVAFSGLEQVLEIRYQKSYSRRLFGQLQFSPPEIVNRVNSTEDQQWEVIVPNDQYLLGASKTLNPGFDWKWKKYYWSRVASYEQSDLENWVGASKQRAASSQDNSYVFNHFGNLPQIRVRLISRWVIVLVASGLVLLLGWGWVYWPVMRSSNSWFTMLGAGVVSWVVYPTFSILVFQAASLGILLCIFTWILHRILNHEVSVKPRTNGSSSQQTHGISHSSELQTILIQPASSNARTISHPVDEPK